jgi:hypothetical protein
MNLSIENIVVDMDGWMDGLSRVVYYQFDII